MTKLEQLKKEAKAICENRGHSIGKFQKSPDKHWSMASCDECGADVFVECIPLPNEQNITGTAAALECRKIAGYTNINKLKERQKREMNKAIEMNKIIESLRINKTFASIVIKRICEHTAYADYFLELDTEYLQQALELAERMNPLNIYMVRDGSLAFKPETKMQSVFDKFPDNGSDANKQGYEAIGPYIYYVDGIIGRETKSLRFYVLVANQTIEVRCNVLNDPLTRRSYSVLNGGHYNQSKGTTIVNDSGHFAHTIRWWGGDQPNAFTLY
jgi:hypothetical protein